MRDIHAEFEAAKARLHEAQKEMEEAALEEVRRLVRGAFPAATQFVVEGEYGESGELGLSVVDPETDDLDDELSEPLMFLAAATGEDYLGRHVIEIVETETCECADTGYLLNQTYGCAEIPMGWTPVQACDVCRRFTEDEDAARAAAETAGPTIIAAYFRGVPTLEDFPPPGDWAINWTEEGSSR